MPFQISPLRFLQNRPAGKSVSLFACYFLLIALALRRYLHYGFTGDESGYVTLNTAEIASHLWLPYIFSAGMDTGHPVLYTYPVAVLWRLFGQSNAAANLMMWICAALSLAAVHRLTEHVVRRRMGDQTPKWAGPAAAVALFSTPLFISHAAQYLDPMPYVALTLWMLLAWVEERRKLVGVLGGLLSLIRITGCLSVLGLGLFDLAYAWAALRKRTWRGVWGALEPYLGSAGIFLGYLFIKLVVLGRPLKTFSGNKVELADWGSIQKNISWIKDWIFRSPPYSFALLLEVAAAACAVTLIKRWLRARGSATVATPCAETAQPGAAWIHGAGIATMILPTLFFCCHPLFPQPRWFLAYHAVFVIMGVHGLLALFGRRLWLVAPILGLWCGAQVARWHEHWVDRYFGGFIPHARSRLSTLPTSTLDILYRKRLNHQAAEWIAKRTKTPFLIGAYPTGSVFGSSVSGYGRSLHRVMGISWLNEQWRRNPAGMAALSRERQVYVVVASWDMTADQKTLEELIRGGGFKEVFEKQSKSEEWIRIYRVRRLATVAGATSGTLERAGGAKPSKS